MKDKINSILIDLFTGKDNQTTDMGRVLWALGVMVFIALTIVSFVQEKQFDYISWGTGFAAVLGAGAVAIKMKETTEPDKKSDNELRAKEIAAYLAKRKKRNSTEDEVL